MSQKIVLANVHKKTAKNWYKNLVNYIQCQLLQFTKFNVDIVTKIGIKSR